MTKEISYTQLPYSLIPALKQIARVTCPPEMQTLGLTDGVIDHFELTLDSIPRHLRVALLVGVGLFEYSAMLWPTSRFTPFSQLDTQLARQYWEMWWHANSDLFHNFAKAVKAFMVMGYYEQPEIKVQLEFLPEVWIAEVAKKRLERYAEEIQKHETLVYEDNPLAGAEVVFGQLNETNQSNETPEAHHARTTR